MTIQPEDECTATWPPRPPGNQMRLYCTLEAGHAGPHEAWTTTGTEPVKTWRDQDPQVLQFGGRQGGKTAATRRAIYEARDRGEHVHIATGKGEFCAAREQPAGCHSPRWEGLES